MKKVLKPRMAIGDQPEYAQCIKCDDFLLDRGKTCFGDGTGDGFNVAVCDNPECLRYGLLTTVWK